MKVLVVFRIELVEFISFILAMKITKLAMKINDANHLPLKLVNINAMSINQSDHV